MCLILSFAFHPDPRISVKRRMLSWEGAASYDLPQMNSTSRLMNSRSIFSPCALTLRKCHLFIGKFYLLKQQQKPNNWKGNSGLRPPLLSKRPFQSVPVLSLTADTPRPLPWRMLVIAAKAGPGSEASGTQWEGVPCGRGTRRGTASAPGQPCCSSRCFSSRGSRGSRQKCHWGG